jgi:hypothetical protein
MKIGTKISGFAIDHPRQVTLYMVLLTLVLGLLAALPSLWPERFPALHSIRIDTNPENMLPDDEPVRVFHDRMKKVFSLNDMIVVGVVNEEHQEGVFNPGSLAKIHSLTEFAKTLRWPAEDGSGQMVGIVEADLIAPSTVDNIRQESLGRVSFEWLMPAPPETQEQAVEVRKQAQNLPFLNGTLVSEDGRAVALYLPITSKDLSYRVYSRLQEKIAELGGPERFLITGLPVAEDVFGVQMFKQMAVSAPLAMLVIFLAMLLFFRKTVLTLPSVILAVVCTAQTMSLLIISGKTIHIMSSMIPIFIIPIQVLDDIHVISEFFDRYREGGDRKKILQEVMDTLFAPLLFTSLTTVAGFASLALTPIPPVQVFGIFVAVGVMLAFIWTITFIPAAIMLFPHRWIEDLAHVEQGGNRLTDWLTPLLHATGRFTFRHPRVIIAAALLLMLVAVYGISLIRVNDNPTKWFEPEHPIRVADRILNEHFGGTYMAYLTFAYTPPQQGLDEYADSLAGRLREKGDEPEPEGAGNAFAAVAGKAGSLAGSVGSEKELLAALEKFADEKYNSVPWEQSAAWDEVLTFLGRERLRHQVFKKPEVLRYIVGVEKMLDESRIVGKANTLPDIVRTVHRELFLGEEEKFTIPDSSDGVAQTLITFQNSHRTQDLWHLVTPDYQRTNMWVQLKSGDNRTMQQVVDRVAGHIDANPPPVELNHDWFGLTYINVIWQDKMVSGMLQAFLGSFLVVLLMMTFLFRSALWGMLSMIPLLLTIGLIYGIIGLVGKDYDMPVAVLSSLSLGLAIDYAIHFLARSRALQQQTGSWRRAVKKVFGEPARAISRNVIVVGVGFLPLLAAPLVPYQTVGIFIAAILFTAGIASLLVLPAAVTLLQEWLFPVTVSRKMSCNRASCIIAALAAAALIMINGHRFLAVGWTTLSLISGVVVAVLMIACWLLSRRSPCAGKPQAEN